MARVLFVNIPSEGHVNPTIGLVQQLVESGEEVVYVCAEEYRSKLAPTGAQFRAYQLNEEAFAGHDPEEIKHPLQFVDFLLRGVIEGHFPQILKIVENEKFDYMIFDSLFGWGGHILSERLGIPAICSVTHFAFNGPIGGSATVEDLPVVEGLDIETLVQQTIALTHKLANLYQVDVPALEDLTRHYGQYKLVFTSRYFQPNSEQFDDSFKFTGPSIIQRQDTPSFPFDLLRVQHQKVVYISMGTVLKKSAEFFKTFFTAFRDVPAQFVMSCGKDLDLEQLSDSIPDNFIVKSYVPQLELLQQADAFITHTGMNSTSEALYYDVPLVMIPLSSDQPMVAMRVEELGAGIKLDKNNLTPTELKSALLKVLNDPSYKERAKLIGDSLRNAGGYKQAVKEIRAIFSTV